MIDCCLSEHFLEVPAVVPNTLQQICLPILDVSIISSCSQKFYVKGFSEADIYSAHNKLFSFFPDLIVD